MEWFILKQDSRIGNSLLIKDLSDIRNYRDLLKAKFDNIPDMSVVYVDSNESSVYPDIFTDQITMISKTLKGIFDLFLNHVEYKHCCLLSRTEDSYKYYYIPTIPPQTIESYKDLHLKRHITSAIIEDDIVFIVSLICAEAILKLKLKGLCLKPLVFKN